MDKCCFIGHRDANGLEKEIYSEIKKLIDNGICEFYSGGSGGFDMMCERAAKSLGGRLVFVPYSMGQIKESDRVWYDEIICPCGNREIEKNDEAQRDRWLVASCSVCLCYVYKQGNAASAVESAYIFDKKIINLWKKSNRMTEFYFGTDVQKN